jgi:uncharacterized protein
MTVVYLTDIHDNFAGVSSVLNQTTADLYILSGDLTYHAFGSDENLFRFIELQEKIRARSEKGTSPFNSLHLAEDTHGGLRPDLLTPSEGKEYQELAAEAHLELRRKYETLNKAVVATQKTCFIIPGNYDISLDGTAVAKYNLHEKTGEFEGIKFAGYGSAPVFTPGIPEELAVPFEETGTGTKLVSRPRDFLTLAKADVFVLHNPAYGTLDKLPRYGHCGSHGLRQAIDDVAPRLVLSGHVHESFGLLKLGSTYFLNPSNFGAVETIDGKELGGYFATFQLQNDSDGQKYLREVSWKRLVGRNVLDICNVKIDKKNRATESINDADEYSAMGRFLL